MTVYAAAVAFMIFLSLILRPENEASQRNGLKKVFCVTCAAALILIVALRGNSVGTDTPGYVNDYRIAALMDFNTVIEKYAPNFGYFLVSKLFAGMGASVHIWFGLVAFVNIGAVSLLIYKYSKDPLLSYIMFFTVGSFGFSMAGLKQTMALSFLFLSYIFLREKKLIWFMAAVAAAAFFHTTAVIFLLAYPVSKIKINLKSVLFFFTLTGAVLFCGKTIVLQVLGLFEGTHYGIYYGSSVTYTLTGFFIQLLILLVCLYYLEPVKRSSAGDAALYGLLFIGLSLQAFAGYNSVFFRLSMYFSVYSAILYPNAISTEKGCGTRWILKLGSAGVFVVYFFTQISSNSSIYPYVFFWN